ncbi:MAG: Ycf66 family protein [Waterburya sp.]
MLSYALAIAVAISSLVLFSTAFLMSDLHRKDDFLWSGVGLFYALVLWYCAKNITGAVLLGQAAATALLVSYNWQTLKLRKAIANPAKAAEINNFSVVQSISGLLKRKKPQVQSETPVKTPTKPQVTEQEIAIPETTSQSTTPEEVSKKTDTEVTSANTPVTDAETIKNNEQTGVESVVDSSSKPVAEAAEKATPTIKENLDNQTSKEQETPPQNPLSSELTQAVSKAENTENEPENTEDKSDSPINTEVMAKDSLSITPDNQSNQAEDSNPDIKTTKPTSPLDSLETVEVAEVLEALPDETSVNRESDQSNIIEVTTTEINTSTEATEIVQNPEENSEHRT